jgi:predicted transcriptional regulator
MCQVHDLRYVSRVFEDDHVMGIETYGSMVFPSMKQILNDVHDADVSVEQNTPVILRLRTFIFPGEKQKAYVES